MKPAHSYEEVYKALRAFESTPAGKLEECEHLFCISSANSYLRDCSPKGDLNGIADALNNGANDFESALLAACEGGQLNIARCEKILRK